MSDDKIKGGEHPAQPEGDQAAQQAPGETEEPTLGAAEAVAAALAEENADLKDRLLRAVAEMDNLRKRTAKEVREAGQYAISGFARDMLVMSDNLSRALETVEQQRSGEDDTSLDPVRDGIRMTQSEFTRLLERHGVKEIAAEGERFDPNLHQAMFEVPDQTIPSGTVTQVVQGGFMIGERVLRPAMVGVSKGGPKREVPRSGESAANENAPPRDDAAGSGETDGDPSEHIDKTV